MGIPSFYRWLVRRYPKVVANAIQDTTFDASSPNPNGLEFDNFYVDMNGIIHPCFHPDDLDSHQDLQPTSFDEVFNSVFEYVDRLLNIIRPRKLLYFAIDGVSPRAKLNQQRAGRYQKAKEKETAEQEEDRLRSQYQRDGKKLLPKVKSQVDDSNIITPGTEFMYEFSKALQCYIQTRLKNNPAWKNLKVILSDANVPGEGEHKIVSFIRSQRSLPDYDVNTRHCLHGLDADLIMLALATHELQISILREDIRGDGSPKPSASCKPFPVRKAFSYEFIHIWILKEYLEFDMQASDAPEGFKFDVERAVDDFVFICFFLGNDFLPHLPSLEIREGALELLMTVYRREFKRLGGYLVDAEQVSKPNGAYLNLERVEKLVLSFASYEDQILQKRTELWERNMTRVIDEVPASVKRVEIPTDIPNAENDDILKNTKQLKEDLRNYSSDQEDVFKTGLFSADKIKYGTAGWKERYYHKKFAIKDHLKLSSIIKEVVKEYTEGLCWVLLYYYSGVPSWTWFYPYHYSPCSSDVKGIDQLQVKFQEGVPFEPFDLLLAVLPPTSAEALPSAYRKLMTDENSDLAPFYPRVVEVDMDGKRFSWQGQFVVPFIDEMRLLSSTRKAKEELKEDEALRNSIHTDLLFIRAFSDFGYQLQRKIEEGPSADNGVGGFVSLNLHTLDSSYGNDAILCVQFGLPKPRIYVPRILENAKFPERTVHQFDINETVLWHENKGSYPFHRNVNQTRYLGAQEKKLSGLSSSNSREGLYNHPNWSKRGADIRDGSHTTNYRGSFRPQRPTPAPPRSHKFLNWRGDLA